MWVLRWAVEPCLYPQVFNVTSSWFGSPISYLLPAVLLASELPWATGPLHTCPSLIPRLSSHMTTTSRGLGVRLTCPQFKLCIVFPISTPLYKIPFPNRAIAGIHPFPDSPITLSIACSMTSRGSLVRSGAKAGECPTSFFSLWVIWYSNMGSSWGHCLRLCSWDKCLPVLFLFFRPANLRTSNKKPSLPHNVRIYIHMFVGHPLWPGGLNWVLCSVYSHAHLIFFRTPFHKWQNQPPLPAPPWLFSI